ERAFYLRRRPFAGPDGPVDEEAVAEVLGDVSQMPVGVSHALGVAVGVADEEDGIVGPVVGGGLRIGLRRVVEGGVRVGLRARSGAGATAAGLQRISTTQQRPLSHEARLG